MDQSVLESVARKSFEFTRRSQEISERVELVKKDCVSLALDVSEWGRTIESNFPPSDERDLLLASITRMKTLLSEMGAISSGSHSA